MKPSVYLSLVFTSLGLCIFAIVAGYRSYRDSFHPLVYLGALCAFLYGAMPLLIASGLPEYFTRDQLLFVQALNLAGVASLLAGVRVGSGKRLKISADPLPNLSKPQRRRIALGAKAAGLLSTLAFAYGIFHAGGFQGAYGHSYGGGWASSGYIRVLLYVSLPALIWLMIAYRGVRLPRREWLWVALFSAPLAIQGALGARRGPTMMLILGIGVAWYMLHRRRPRLSTVLVGALAIGTLALFLVANRNHIYLGSRYKPTRSPLSVLAAYPGNTYTYGGGVVINRKVRANYGWGRRYLVAFLVRPIPRPIWKNEYREASLALGIPNVAVNGGFGTSSFVRTVGWVGPEGSWPGVVADLWAAFWWFSLAGLFLIGLLFGSLWARALARGGPWLVLYAITLALSPYLIMQGVEEMGFRLLVLGLIVWLIWKYGAGKRRARYAVRRVSPRPGFGRTGT